jgi:hypothetical protein
VNGLTDTVPNGVHSCDGGTQMYFDGTEHLFPPTGTINAIDVGP